MEKVRIGNDIQVKYTVLRDGQPESFAGATNIVVQVKNEAYGKVIPSTFSILNNIITIDLDAKDCVLCGKHRVTLSYNRGNDITIDALAFELVQFTSQTGGTEIVGVELVTVNISGDIGIAIPDNNKIDLDGLNSNIDKLHFKPDTLVQLAEIGDVRYSPENRTLEVKVSDTVSIQLGQEMQTRVKNDAGVQINNGQLVYIDSASGANPLAKIASTTDANIAQRTFGMATENIANNGFGAITTEGLVRDVNTAAFTEGDMLWLGINGAVTNIEPVAPTPKISVGMVLMSNVANGVIYVKIRAIARNQKLSDVYAPTMTGGDVLRWNSTTLRFETFNVTTALAGKADLVGGKIPTSQLPAYVNDVLEYANLAAFPATGETGKIYVALDTNLIYRWSGSAYVEISKSLALGETSSTAYRGDRGKTAYDHSQATGNVHNTTASQIPNTPAGTIAATTVQAAINEIDGDVVQVRADLNVLNITYMYPLDDGMYYNIESARNKVPQVYRKNGLIIYFLNSNNKWEKWQFNSKDVINLWGNTTYWSELSNYTKLNADIISSAFNNGTLINDLVTTSTIVNSISRIEFPFNTENRVFYLGQLKKDASTGMVTINIREYIDSNNSVSLYYNSFNAMNGFYTYNLQSNVGIIKLTANFDRITLLTLPGSPQNPLTSTFKAYTYSRPNSELPSVIQKNFGIFVNTANIEQGYNNVTDQAIRSLLSIRITGDWYDRYFMLTKLQYIDGKILCTISEKIYNGSVVDRYASSSTINYDITKAIGVVVFNDSNNALGYRIGLSYELTIDNKSLPNVTQSGTIFASTSVATKTYERYGIDSSKVLDGNKKEIKTHNSVTEMLKSESMSPIQIAGNFQYRLSEKTLPRKLEHFTPMWNRIKLVNSKVEVEHKILTPPTVQGHNNNHCVLQDVGHNDTFYIAGVSDKKGIIYKSIDYGNTIIPIFDINTLLTPNESITTVWCTRELPSYELMSCVSILDSNTNEIRTYIYVSENSQSQWSRSKNTDGTDLTLTYYKEVDEIGNITFEVYGRIINGWGFSSYKNYVLLTEYGYNSKGGVSSKQYYDSVGHMITGKMYLSTDYGETFKVIFDYINPPSNITFLQFPGLHHSHGGFIDRYMSTTDIPRIIGLMGDQENRIVYSDDLGVTWKDNRLGRNGTMQSVSGIDTSEGYILLPDNTISQDRNGVQYIHRGYDISKMYSDLVCNFLRVSDYSIFSGTGSIIYVGGNIFQKTANSPILACYTPETSTRFDAGARGGIVISGDLGKTWEEIWRDDLGCFKSIQYAMVFQTEDGTIYVSPSALNALNYDGQGLYGRLIKIKFK